MNKVILSGRLTADPEIRHTAGENSHTVATFTLAVDRKVARNNGENKADFIRCQAWDRKAEVVEKYYHKGIKIALAGRIQTGSYDDQNGNKVYTTDVVCEELEFCESKNNSSTGTTEASQPVATGSDGFMSIPTNMDDDMPFV